MNFPDFLTKEMVAKDGIYYNEITNQIFIEIRNVIGKMVFKINPIIHVHFDEHGYYNAYMVKEYETVEKGDCFTISLRKPFHIDVGDILVLVLVFDTINTVEFELERELVVR